MKRYIIATVAILFAILVGFIGGIITFSRFLESEDAAKVTSTLEIVAPKGPVNSSVVEHKTPETTAALVTTRSTEPKPQIKAPESTKAKTTEPSLPAMPLSASSSSSVSIGAIIRLILIGVIIVAILLLRRKDYEEKRNFH